jgi:hypothetical protein
MVMNRRSGLGLALTVALVAGGAASLLGIAGRSSSAQPKAPASSGPATPGAAPMAEIKGFLPDQSHAMMDVGYHFSSLWFAVKHKNWPLARFMYDETRSHLRWAVRIKPVRKITGDVEVSLDNILQSIENGPLDDLGRAIQAQDAGAVARTYRATLEGCYACHKASEKPYLRPKIPTAVGDIINFDPKATWPQ